MKDILTNISPEQAAGILKQLWDKGDVFRKAILAEAENMLTTVEVNEVAQDVLFNLDFIDVHELWDRSGPGRDGYTSTEEMAMEMVEDELSPFNDQIDRYHNLKMYELEKIYCMGVLKGLYLFEKEGDSEFRDWATDIPGECYRSLLETWQDRVLSQHHKDEMDDFLKTACPDWANPT